MRGLGLGFTNPVGQGHCCTCLSVFELRCGGWCRWGVGKRL